MPEFNGKYETAAALFGTNPETGEILQPLMSIAASLKRIADAMTDRDGFTNPISAAIQNGISLGAQDYIGHLTRSGR